ncbi:MAG: hypothetical protein HZA25_01095 [Candidatus Niyogibacteria bacterium]|nr:hypothetical protein [Candidatus Niyogibacteria bacterium]
MPHVSKNKLSHKTYGEIIDFFNFTVRQAAKQKNGTYNIFYALLTKTERVMLAKRLAVFFFTEKGLSVWKISLLLKMSPSTTARLRHAIQSKSANDPAWKFLKNFLKQRRQMETFTGRLERFLEILISFVPPNKNNIKARWRFLDESN